MIFHFSIYTVLYMVAAGVSSIAAAVVYGSRRAPGGWWLFAWNIAAVAWAVAEAFDYSSLTLTAHVTAAKFSYFGATTVPVLFLLFALQFSGRVRRPAPWAVGLLLVIPVASIVAAFTNEAHHLVWPGFTMLADKPYLIIYQHGPMYWLVTIYSLAVVLAATLLIIDTAVRARGIYRWQSAALVAAAAVPWVAELAYSLSPESFPGLDPALTLSATGAIIAFTVSRLRLLDLVLVPREVIVEEMTDGLVVLDKEARILEINPAAVRLLGLAGMPAIGTPALEAFHHWSPLSVDAAQAVYEERATTIESPTGAVLSVDRSRLEGSAETQARDLFILRDITGQARAEQALNRAYEDLQARMVQIEALQEELREQATRDPLTGLHNRRYLAEELEREFARALRDGSFVSVVMLDIDHFKEVNDTFGHGAGDDMLRFIAADLLVEIRRGDIACRYGGDEFVVVLANTDSESAQRRAEEWRTRLEAVMAAVGDDRVNATASLGVATFPTHGSAIGDVVAAADRAVYASKAAGRNRVSVAPVVEVSAAGPERDGTADGLVRDDAADR